MNKTKDLIYFIDISEFLNSRITTGIQRVIREFLRRLIDDTMVFNVIYFDTNENTYQCLSLVEINAFLSDIKNYNIQNQTTIDIFSNKDKKKVFFDIDSIWNSTLKRKTLYPKLKLNNFKICNFIYDLIPVLFPKYFYEKTRENFQPYLDAVFEYSDLVFLDSKSAEQDFITLFEKSKFTREITTNVVYLGSDFLIDKTLQYEGFRHLLSKKYILFVGTVEPRKEHSLVLKAYEEIYKTNTNLNLVFIGKVGWDVDEFIFNLREHPLKDKTIFHYENIDDNTLSYFYKHAFVVTYLSKYEGYGLPISESLEHSNITIASKNSSLVEVGQEFVDYVDDSLLENLINIIQMYISDTDSYRKKKAYIKKNYKRISWDNVYNTLIKTISKL